MEAVDIDETRGRGAAAEEGKGQQADLMDVLNQITPRIPTAPEQLIETLATASRPGDLVDTSQDRIRGDPSLGRTADAPRHCATGSWGDGLWNSGSTLGKHRTATPPTRSWRLRNSVLYCSVREVAQYPSRGHLSGVDVQTESQSRKQMKLFYIQLVRLEA